MKNASPNCYRWAVGLFEEQRGGGLKCKGLLSIQDLRSSQSRILLAAPFSNVTESVRTPWITIPKQHDDTTTMLLTSTALFSFLSAFSLLFPIVSPKDDAFPANGLAFYKHHQLIIIEQLLCITPQKNKKQILVSKILIY